MFLYFDFWYLVVMGIGALLSGLAAAKTRGAYEKYSRIRTRRGLSGADVARQILHANGIHDVRVETTPGFLSDHYDPRSKTLRLSERNFRGDSIAAVGVAAHEVGHAIQHAQRYPALNFRSAWVPIANTGSGLSMIVLLIAFLLGGVTTGAGTLAAWIGIGLFATSTIFTLVTLPVEFDASRRALITLEQGGIVTQEELGGARSVLNAAALTYVAAFITSLLMLLYWAMRLGLLGGRSQD